LWTVEHFSINQARAYRDVILDALRSLQDGPTIIGAKNRSGLRQDLKILHVARKGKRGRHFIVFDASMAGHIQVLRILHDAMDIQRHLPSHQ
jgi:toxin ParE1/3/4